MTAASVMTVGSAKAPSTTVRVDAITAGATVMTAVSTRKLLVSTSAVMSVPLTPRELPLSH
jgi:hypothetical protein